MKSIYKRLKAETPHFFKALRNLAFTVGGSALAVIAANGTMELGLSVDILSTIKTVIAVCVAVAGTSQLTKQQ